MKSRSLIADIDLLVSFKPGSRLVDSGATCGALEYATGRDVDLITTLDGQTKAFRDSVLRDGVSMHEVFDAISMGCSL